MTTLTPAFGAFTRRASRRLKLIVSAGAIALAGVASAAAPARAQTSDELIRFLLGAAAVAVVVRAIDNSGPRSHGRVPRGVLPEACLETVRLHRRHVDVYHTGCLGWYGISQLPRRCETRVRTDRGPRSYHLAQCLHESGWRPQYASVPSRPHYDPVPPRGHHWHDRQWGWQGHHHRHGYHHRQPERWSRW